MKHKNKSKYESDSSEESSSSSSSSSSESDTKKNSKRHRRNSSSSDDYIPSTKKKKSYSESDDSDVDKYKKKTVTSAVEKLSKHGEKTQHHSGKQKHEKRSDHREKDNDSRRDKHVDNHDTDRRKDENRHRRDEHRARTNDYRDRSRHHDEQNENRHLHHHQRRERLSQDRSRTRDERDNKYLNDKRRDRPWNRRNRSRSKSFDHANANWGKNNNADPKSDKKTKEKDKPNFGLSGKLTEETNTYKGVVIKYSEPPEARKPRRRWRLYPFKGEKSLQTLYIHRQSAYLIGRDRKIADLPVDHPSCSKQHAALQYRLVQFTRDDGTVGKRVRPYVIDLDSANGTFLNNKKIEPKKYVELLERDVIKFGFSSREYVLLHENSKDEELDDDVKLEDDEGEVKVKKEEH